MKASVKFRDDKKPLFRAKVPLNILGMPFQSGIVAGESKELTLNLGTFFASGPSIRIAYRPNDKWNPFSFIVKTGTGPFGSPTSTSMLMSAEFNLLSRGNPTFMLHFKPQFGDFTIKKSQTSNLDKLVRYQHGAVPENNGSVEVGETPEAYSALTGKKISILPAENPSGGAIAGLFAGTEVEARTAVPVRGHAVLNFRWGVRVPSELKSGGNPMNSIAFQKIPFLVMNKIGIEHVYSEDPKSATATVGPQSALTFPGNADVAEVCFSLKRQMEILQDDNRLLRKSVDDLRRQMAGGVRSNSPARNSDFGKYRDYDRNGSKNPPSSKYDRRNNEKSGDFSGFSAKSTEGDVSEELKKALK
ncbi:hypothetical protein FEM48_Zijuj12G0086900 [Ziziphus jujuba var. spinosa]|uniref:Uncharacterized protein n=1 Tax=Ziziphus jujuba var. spinosa TaxID=714518 RepID=A0A978UCA7_ZIZJJ|nr:hypothetical protein FEM48_Zijuj12G0086900 [Ziziphus jujuba var. spinosa]